MDLVISGPSTEMAVDCPEKANRLYQSYLLLDTHSKPEVARVELEIGLRALGSNHSGAGKKGGVGGRDFSPITGVVALQFAEKPQAKCERQGSDMRSIRAFQSDDLPVIQSIRKRAFQPIYDSFRDLVGEDVFRLEFSDWDQAQADYLESICAKNSGKEMYVATVDKAVVGFIGLSMNQASRRGEIDLNAVDPGHQRDGIGEFMYQFAIRRMQSAGMKVVKVSTGGDSSHAPARRAYEKAGFNVFIPSITMYRKFSD